MESSSSWVYANPSRELFHFQLAQYSFAMAMKWTTFSLLDAILFQFVATIQLCSYWYLSALVPSEDSPNGFFITHALVVLKCLVTTSLVVIQIKWLWKSIHDRTRLSAGFHLSIIFVFLELYCDLVTPAIFYNRVPGLVFRILSVNYYMLIPILVALVLICRDSRVAATAIALLIAAGINDIAGVTSALVPDLFTGTDSDILTDLFVLYALLSVSALFGIAALGLLLWWLLSPRVGGRPKDMLFERALAFWLMIICTVNFCIALTLG